MRGDSLVHERESYMEEGQEGGVEWLYIQCGNSEQIMSFRNSPGFSFSWGLSNVILNT